jgi:hypothetical protein
MLESIGLALCLAAIVLHATVALQGISGGRGLSSQKEGKDPRGTGWVARVLAIPLQLLGVVLIYLGLERLPFHWVDLLLITGVGVALVSLAFSVSLRNPIVRAPLSTVSIVCTLFAFMAGEISPVTQWDPLSAGMLRSALVLMMIGAFGAMAMAVRRLLRLERDARVITLVGLAVMVAALGVGRGAPSGDARPFEVYSTTDGETQPEEVVLTLEVRDSEALYTRRVEARTEIPLISMVWDYAFLLLFFAFVTAVFQAFISAMFYRVLLTMSLGIGALAVVVLLCGMIYYTVGDTKTALNPMEVGLWLQEGAFTEISPAVWVRDASFLHGGRLSLTFASASATWLVLLAATPFFFTVVSYRLRALTSPVRNPDAEKEGKALETAEYLFMGIAFTGATFALIVGAMASYRWWGVMDAYDSRALLCVCLWMLSGLYFFTQWMWVEKRAFPSYLVLMVGVGCVVFLVGPQLGWVLPSIYPP